MMSDRSQRVFGARRRAAAFLIVALAALLPLAGGCFNPFQPRLAHVAGFASSPPTPNTPINVVLLYSWCWNKRDPDLYREIFTDDYQFFFNQADSAGNLYRNRALNREEELEIATNIFVRGTATEPPPASISLTFDPSMVPLPDSRRGKDGRYHKEIAANTLLRIHQPDFEVTGVTRFFVVRGDSALIPKELTDRGFKPDSARWYIDQIDDETVGPSGVPARAGARAARPAMTLDQVATWGQVRAYWDDTRLPVAVHRP